MLEFLDDSRVKPTRDGFDIDATIDGIAGVHVSQTADEQWCASWIHTGALIPMFGRQKSAEEMVNMVLAHDEKWIQADFCRPNMKTVR